MKMVIIGTSLGRRAYSTMDPPPDVDFGWGWYELPAARAYLQAIRYAHGWVSVIDDQFAQGRELLAMPAHRVNYYQDVNTYFSPCAHCGTPTRLRIEGASVNAEMPVCPVCAVG